MTGTGAGDVPSGLPAYMQHLPPAEVRRDRAQAQALPSLLCGIASFLCAILAIPAIALGVTSLRRSRPDQRVGQVMAVAGIFLSVLAVAAWAMLGASWWHARQQVHTREFGADGERVGQCMTFNPDSGGWSTDAGSVACTEPHEAQVMANLRLPPWHWTTSNEMLRRFRQTCQEWVDPMLRSRNDSEQWLVNAVVPRYEADWNLSHVISCVAVPRAGTTTVDLSP